MNEKKIQTKTIIEKLGKILFAHIFIGLIVLFLELVGGRDNGGMFVLWFLSLVWYEKVGIIIIISGGFIVYGLFMFGFKFVFEWIWLQIVARYDGLKLKYAKKRINTMNEESSLNDANDKAGERGNLVQGRVSGDGGTTKPDIT